MLLPFELDLEGTVRRDRSSLTAHGADELNGLLISNALKEYLHIISISFAEKPVR